MPLHELRRPGTPLLRRPAAGPATFAALERGGAGRSWPGRDWHDPRPCRSPSSTPWSASSSTLSAPIASPSSGSALRSLPFAISSASSSARFAVLAGNPPIASPLRPQLAPPSRCLALPPPQPRDPPPLAPRTRPPQVDGIPVSTSTTLFRELVPQLAVLLHHGRGHSSHYSASHTPPGAVRRAAGTPR